MVAVFDQLLGSNHLARFEDGDRWQDDLHGLCRGSLWRIYYGDGTTIDSRGCAWEDAPADNVQVLIRFHETLDKRGRPLREMYHGSPGNAGDYYWQFGAGTARDVPEGADVKYGRMIDKTEFMAIYNRALGDYEW